MTFLVFVHHAFFLSATAIAIPYLKNYPQCQHQISPAYSALADAMQIEVWFQTKSS